jgi:hypothetical protein
MNQKTNLPRKYNPHKASFQTPIPKDPIIEARLNAFWEGAKITSPKLYQEHQRVNAIFEAQRPFIEAMLDDPDVIAMLDDFMLDSKQQHFSDELALLGIEAGASKRDIKNAYRRKARKLHPDKGGSDEAMKHLNAAYKRLLAATPE